MKDAVLNIFYDWSKQFEGEVNHMYLDCKGLVTIGIGNLIDPISAAMTLPLKRNDKSLATATQISAEWHLIKSHTELAREGYQAAGRLCLYHLEPADIATLVDNKLKSNEAFMKLHYFKNWDSFSACAQLACSSMAWACGAGWPMIFKNCSRSVLNLDWAAASLECSIDSQGNVGVIPRNKANIALFLKAADSNQDPEAL